ncbi:MAG: hypothetical protein ACR5LA_09630 [Wolbachia sp.]
MFYTRSTLPQQHMVSYASIKAPTLTHAHPCMTNSCHSHFGSCHDHFGSYHNYHDTYHNPYDGLVFFH